jgi:hypothetical protein
MGVLFGLWAEVNGLVVISIGWPPFDVQAFILVLGTAPPSTWPAPLFPAHAKCRGLVSGEVGFFV